MHRHVRLAGKPILACRVYAKISARIRTANALHVYPISMHLFCTNQSIVETQRSSYFVVNLVTHSRCCRSIFIDETRRALDRHFYPLEVTSLNLTRFMDASNEGSTIVVSYLRADR